MVMMIMVMIITRMTTHLPWILIIRLIRIQGVRVYGLGGGL